MVILVNCEIEALDHTLFWQSENYIKSFKTLSCTASIPSIKSD